MKFFSIKERISPVRQNRLSDVEDYLRVIGDFHLYKNPNQSLTKPKIRQDNQECYFDGGTGFGDISCLGDGHGDSGIYRWYDSLRQESIAYSCGGGMSSNHFVWDLEQHLDERL